MRAIRKNKVHASFISAVFKMFAYKVAEGAKTKKKKIGKRTVLSRMNTILFFLLVRSVAALAGVRHYINTSLSLSIVSNLCIIIIYYYTLIVHRSKDQPAMQRLI